MAHNQKSGRKNFRSLEKDLTKIILGDLLLFLLMMVLSSMGIGWAKILIGLLILVISALGDLFLFLINEYRRPRSHWMLVSFASLFMCTLVSLITGSPAPGL